MEHLLSCIITRSGIDVITEPVDGVMNRIMAPRDVHTLIPGTCKYVTLHSKEELNLQMKLRLLIKWSIYTEMILYYLGGLKVITRVFTSEREQKRESKIDRSVSTCPILLALRTEEWGHSPRNVEIF